MLLKKLFRDFLKYLSQISICVKIGISQIEHYLTVHNKNTQFVYMKLKKHSKRGGLKC